MKKTAISLFIIFNCIAASGQTLFDSFTDNDFTVNPVWGGTTSTWQILQSSGVAGGATNSLTLHLVAQNPTGTEYLSSPIYNWSLNQEWGIFIGRRSIPATAADQSYFWLYANEANLNSATVDGYRIAYGDNFANDFIRLEYIVDGVVSSTVITSTGTTGNGIINFGILVRVKRSASGVWELFTSTLPQASATGAKATDIPNAANTPVSQGTGTHNAIVPVNNGYIGVAALHSLNGMYVQEFDQIYFTASPANTPVIHISPARIDSFISVIYVPSIAKPYVVEGVDLTHDIVIYSAYGESQCSLTNNPFVPATTAIHLTPVAGVVPPTTIYVRMVPTVFPFTPMNFDDIANASTGAVTQNLMVTGNVLADEPTVQSTLTFVSSTNNSITVNVSGGNGTFQILVAKESAPVDFEPQDAHAYPAAARQFGVSASAVGNGNYVVAGGQLWYGGPVTITGLTAGKTYHFAVFDYEIGYHNGPYGQADYSENYLLPGGTGNASTLNTPFTYNWTAGSGAWTTAANWTPARTSPATNDILKFSNGNTLTITNVPTQAVRQLQVTSGTNVTLQAAVASTALNINGTAAGDDLKIDAGSSLNITGTNAYSINVATGNTGVIDGSVSLTGGSHKLTAANANGITFNSGAIFTAGPGFSGNAFGNGMANAVVFTNGSVYQQAAGSDPFALVEPASVVVFNPGSLFKVLGNVTPSVSGRAYGNFELAAPAATINATGNSLLSIENLTVTNGSLIFGMTTAGMNIKGNIAVAAGAGLSFAPASAGTINLIGTFAQSISSSGTLSFGADQKININNAAGVTLNTPVTVLGVLNFTSGRVTTTATNLLTMGAASSITGASNASFVFGPLKKIGNTAFTFPVGKANGLAPIRVSNFAGASAATDEFIAEYIRESGADLGPVTDLFIDHVSSCDYWKLDLNNGTPTVDVTLYWSSNNGCGSTYITNLASLEIGHFGSGSWNQGSTGLSIKNGIPAAGDITWPGVNNFSPFSLASTGAGNPLPITINYFNGTKQNGNHLLNWKVTCVSTPSATLEMQRSADGSNYSTIYSIFATALRCQQPFDHTDAAPFKGINYYRLKMTDADGKISYSSIVALLNAVKGFDIISIAPNPVTNGNFKLNVASAQASNMELVIIDMQGRLVNRQSIPVIAGFTSIPVNISNLSAGTYTAYGTIGEERSKMMRFVKQ